MTRSRRKFLPLLSLGILLQACAPTPAFHEARNLSAKPFNQLDLAGNACGPAALLNSFRFGGPRWQKLSENPPGLTDRERIRAIARGPAMRESSSLPGRARWSRNGINLIDLRDVANEIAGPPHLPAISQQTLFLKPAETQKSHLHRVHSLLARSLAEGFPPILSIRRYVKRDGKWTSVQGHFVTLTSVPGKMRDEADGFPVKCVDPLGGHFREGNIAIAAQPFMGSDATRNPNLEADFPGIVAGKRFLRRGEESILAVSAAIGRF